MVVWEDALNADVKILSVNINILETVPIFGISHSAWFPTLHSDSGAHTSPSTRSLGLELSGPTSG